MLSYYSVQMANPPRFGTKSLMSWEKLSIPGKLGQLVTLSGLRVGVQFGFQKLGRGHSGLPSEEGQCVHPPTGLALWLPLGPAGQQQPANPLHLVSNREGETGTQT